MSAIIITGLIIFASLVFLITSRKPSLDEDNPSQQRVANLSFIMNQKFGEYWKYMFSILAFMLLFIMFCLYFLFNKVQLSLNDKNVKIISILFYIFISFIIIATISTTYGNFQRETLLKQVNGNTELASYNARIKSINTTKIIIQIVLILVSIGGLVWMLISQKNK